MRHRYELDRSLRRLYLIKTPFRRGLFPPANRFLSLFTLKSGDGIKVEKYRGNLLVSPSGEEGNLPVILYFHGGAFVYKAAPYHYKLVKRYVTQCRMRVLMVDYPLSPDKRYPASVDYSISLYRNVLLDFNGVKTALMGDSAGGEIALSTAMRIIDEGLRIPGFLSLIYPVVSPVSTPSKERFTDTPVWNSKLNEKMWSCYLGKEKYRSIFDYCSLHSFPPIYVETCCVDALHDEGVMLSSLLSSHGVKTSYFEIPLAPHGFDMCLGSEITAVAVERRCRYIKEGFSS